jgi:ketosteroid isomerase-like protein
MVTRDMAHFAPNRCHTFSTLSYAGVVPKTEEFMTTQEVADELVKLCREGKFHEAVESLYADNIVSMEAGAPPGQSRESRGLAAVKAKGEWWQANHEVHAATVEGALVAGSHFTATFKMDVTFKPHNRRFQMDEVAVYKVQDGKVVYEEFFYAMGS